MIRSLINIYTLTIAAAILYASGSFCLHAQSLQTPERWKEEFRKVSPIFRNDTVTIRFLGDVMMHRNQISCAATKDSTYDFSSYFSLIRKEIEDADIALANMEFSLGGKPYSGYPAFSAPDEIAEYAAECGIDIFLLANNHIYDRGKSGASRSLGIYRELYRKYGTRYIGLASDADDRYNNHPLMTAAGGIRLAFINATYATNGGRRSGWPAVNYLDNENDILLALEEAERKHADFTIVLPHWGEEYMLRHSAAQARTAGWLAANGADLIIGTHPHVVQDTVSFCRKDMDFRTPVIYSLGNTVSNMSAVNTQLGLMATLKIVRHSNGDIRMLPIEMTFLWCSRPGGMSRDNYIVVPVEEYIGRRSTWHGKWDYDNMMATYKRVLKETGIEQKHN